MIDEFRDYVNNMRSGYDVNVVFVMPTRSGFHFIAHPFNLQQYYEMFQYRFPEYKAPDVKKNHLTLLYEDL